MATVHSPEINQLRKDIEQYIGQSLNAPSDFQLLIQQIWQHNHIALSLSTIKRLWGYVDSNGAPRISTLNTLSQFLGYNDWNAYLVSLEQTSNEDSAIFQGDGISTKDLHPNQHIEVTWQPNRKCIFRYLGDNHFVVEESHYAKLHIGDQFDAVMFVVGHPMYLDHILCSDGTYTSYVAGKKHGITSVKLL